MQLQRINDREFALACTNGNEKEDARQLETLLQMMMKNKVPFLRISGLRRGLTINDGATFALDELNESPIHAIRLVFDPTASAAYMTHVDVTPEEARKLCAQFYNLHNDEIIEVATNFGKITFHCIEK